MLPRVVNEDWVPPDIDLSKPNVARIYDYYLGGAHNLAIDREFAKRAIAVMPDVPSLSWLNRLFLRRAVRYCVERGVRQFLDIGSGIPTEGHTHEIAQTIAPGARVVYVDNEAVAVAHSELILRDNPDATVVRADARRPDDVLDAPATRELLDFDQPIAILMLALIHFVPDDGGPIGLIGRYRDAVAPGSHLIMSTVTADRHPGEMDRFAELYRNGSTPLIPRGKAEFTALFAGWDLVEPGVSPLAEWHPAEDDPPLPGGGGHADELGYGGVARKP
jgi:hypothetical protein